jgi:hypothetical protein
VVKDPRVEASVADVQAQVALHRQILDKTAEVNTTITKIRDIRKQVNAALERLAGSNAEKPHPRAKQFKDAAKPLLDSLTAVENELIQSKLKSSQDILNFPPRLDNKLVSLASYVESADSKPTQAAVEMAKELFARADAQIARFKPVLQTELPKFMKLLQDQNIPQIIVD